MLWAVMPCLSALNRDFAFPSSVFGPVLFCALRRLASACAADWGFLDLVFVFVLGLVTDLVAVTDMIAPPFEFAGPRKSRVVATSREMMRKCLRARRTLP